MSEIRSGLKIRILLHTSHTRLAKVSHPGYKPLVYRVLYGYVNNANAVSRNESSVISFETELFNCVLWFLSRTQFVSNTRMYGDCRQFAKFCLFLSSFHYLTIVCNYYVEMFLLYLAVHKVWLFEDHNHKVAVRLIHRNARMTMKPTFPYFIFFFHYLSIYLSMALEPFVGPWPFFQFLDHLHSR
jgi:hypothetical protein